MRQKGSPAGVPSFIPPSSFTARKLCPGKWLILAGERPQNGTVAEISVPNRTKSRYGLFGRRQKKAPATGQGFEFRCIGNATSSTYKCWSRHPTFRQPCRSRPLSWPWLRPQQKLTWRKQLRARVLRRRQWSSWVFSLYIHNGPSTPPGGLSCNNIEAESGL